MDLKSYQTSQYTAVPCAFLPSPLPLPSISCNRWFRLLVHHLTHSRESPDKYRPTQNPLRVQAGAQEQDGAPSLSLDCGPSGLNRARAHSTVIRCCRAVSLTVGRSRPPLVVPSSTLSESWPALAPFKAHPYHVDSSGCTGALAKGLSDPHLSDLLSCRTA